MTLPDQEDDLVRLYRMASNERTSAHVDERILAAAARRGKQDRHRKYVRNLLLATAAVLALGVAVRAPIAPPTGARPPVRSLDSAAAYLLRARAPISSNSSIRSQLLNENFSEMHAR